MTNSAFKRTQMRDLYVTLRHLKQSEQVCLAEFHAQDMAMLSHRIKQDLKTVSGYPSLAKKVLVDENRTPLPAGVDVAQIKSTAEFASVLKEGGEHAVAGHP